MKLIPEILKAFPLPDYKLFVEFIDGINGEVDLKKRVGKGVFEYWNNENNFRNFFLQAIKSCNGMKI